MNTVSGANGPLALMPSPRAAAMAGPMIVSSSSPNRPPSPACGLRPATAMRGRGWPQRTEAACAMRSVSSTASKLIASIARRSDTWMVTSTVRSSSLASIMRTAGTRPSTAASACSISVCPGKCTPAAASASLWIGAVTMPATSPRIAMPAAAVMHAAAAAPARASTRPMGAAIRSAGNPSGCHTGMQFGGTCSASPGCSIVATASMPPVNPAARRITATSPTTKQPVAPSPRNSLAMISGPMPQASPCVIASGLVSGVRAAGTKLMASLSPSRC